MEVTDTKVMKISLLGGEKVDTVKIEVIDGKKKQLSVSAGWQRGQMVILHHI